MTSSLKKKKEQLHFQMGRNQHVGLVLNEGKAMRVNAHRSVGAVGERAAMA